MDTGTILDNYYKFNTTVDTLIHNADKEQWSEGLDYRYDVSSADLTDVSSTANEVTLTFEVTLDLRINHVVLVVGVTEFEQTYNEL